MSKNLNEIIESIKKLTVAELVNLVDNLEEEFDVKAGFAMAAAAPVAAAAVEESTTKTVLITKVSDKKLEMIKKVREYTNMDLMPAKQFCDAISESAPGSLGEFDNDKAAKIAEEFKALGCEVKLQ